MTDWEAVDKWVAEKVMGYEPHEVFVRTVGTFTTWYDKNGPAMDNGGWHPHDSWEQCGQVIEAMEVAGWELHLSRSLTNAQIKITSWLKAGENIFDCSAQLMGPTRYGIILAAARAYGYKDES